MNFPVLTATGDFDDDQPGALRYYRNYVAHAQPTGLAKTFLVIGPWDHLGTQHPEKQIGGISIRQAAVIDMNKLHADCYDWVLGREPQPAFLQEPVAYFMMGADEWRYAKTLAAASSGATINFFLSAPEPRASYPTFPARSLCRRTQFVPGLCLYENPMTNLARGQKGDACKTEA